MIGPRLKKLRKSRRISQAELAEKLSLSRYTVSSYENGNSDPSDEITVMICRTLNVSADYLLGLVDTPIPYGNENKYVLLPNDISPEMLKEIKGFIAYQIHKHRGFLE